MYKNFPGLGRRHTEIRTIGPCPRGDDHCLNVAIGTQPSFIMSPATWKPPLSKVWCLKKHQSDVQNH